MDPNKALEELRKLAQLLVDRDSYDDSDPSDFAEQFQALDEWLTRGGFLPEEWDHETS